LLLDFIIANQPNLVAVQRAHHLSFGFLLSQNKLYPTFYKIHAKYLQRRAAGWAP
jgi:thiosulfate reductase cytochrome b subunit